MKADRDASIEGLRVLIENIEELKLIVNDYMVRYSELQDENARLKAERDKAVEDIESMLQADDVSESCEYCVMHGIDEYCINCDKSGWRGLEGNNA